MKKLCILRMSLLCALLVPLLGLQAQEGPGVQFKSVDWMMRDPYLWASTGKRQLDQTKSGEDWWYSLKKLYNGSNNHIGYVAVGYSNFVNQGYDNSTECKIVDATDAPDDFHCGTQQQGATYQTIGLYDLAGNMYRCKTFNLGHFWDVIQSEDRQSLVAVGYTDNTMDQHPNEWSGESNEYLIYNPTFENNPASSNPDVLDYCEGNSRRKMSVVKMNLSLQQEWNYIYGAPQLSNYSKEEIRNNVMAFGFSIESRYHSGNENFVIVGNSYQTPGDVAINNTNDGATAFVIEIDEKGYLNWTHSPFTSTNPTTPSSAQAVYKSTNGLLWVAGYQYTNSISTGSQKARIFITRYTGSANPTSNAYTELLDPIQFPSMDLNHFNTAADLTEDYQGNILMAAITKARYKDYPIITGTENTFGSHSMKATGMVFTLKNTVDPAQIGDQTRNPFTIDGELKAYDLQMGITSTSDNGFAIIGSKVPKNNSGDYWNLAAFSSIYPNYFPFGCTPGFEHNWDADAYIAKYTDVSGQWAKRWEQTIDTDGSRGSFPGQIKKQECVYKIEEAEDGGLVFAGNTSHNHDDSYLVKVHNECVLDAFESYAFDKPSFQDTENWIEWPTEDGIDYYLSQNETWNGVTQSIAGRILVQNGRTLTIKNSTISFADGGRLGIPTDIIVLKGGTLIIDNSTLTVDETCPGTMWSGIQVRGNPNTLDVGEQGKIIVKNESVIEHARMAILAGGEYTNTNNYGFQGGGIVQVFNKCIFRNNRFDVKFYPYAVTRAALNSPSYIRNSEFHSDGQLRDPSYIYTTHQTNGVSYELGTGQHIQIWDVHGVEISDNKFFGNNTIEPFLWATGISCYDGHFYATLNEFDKQYRAMEISYSVPLYFAPSIERNTFTNIRETAIYLKNGLFAHIFDNTFDLSHGTAGQIVTQGSADVLQFSGPSLPGSGPSDPIIPRGLYMHDCQKYFVSQNEFVNNSTGYRGNGLTVYNENQWYDAWNTNEIYDNQFTKLAYSSFGNKNNYGNGIDDEKGLDFKCNQYSGNAYDVLTTVGPGISPAQGAAGDAKAPAGNTFDGCGLPNAELFNNGEPLNQGQHYTYYHHNGNGSSVAKPSSGCYKNGFNSMEVNLFPVGQPFDREVACDQKFELGSGRVANGESGYENAKALYLAYLTTYTNTIDDGDKQALLNAIANDNTPAQIAALFDPVAPYLSDDVMVALISNKPTAMPDADLVAILVDNSPLTQAVLDEVASRSPALNDIDQTTLDAAQTGVSARSQMESTLGYYAQEMALWRDEWTRAIAQDGTVANRPSELRRSLADDDNALTKALVVSSYAMEYDLANTQAAINDLRADYDGARDLADLLELKLQWALDSVNEDSIIRNPNLRSTLTAMMNDENSIASLSAKAMLAFVDNQLLEKTDLYEPVQILEIDVYPGDGSSAKKDNEASLEQKVKDTFFTAYPNPTTGFVNFNAKGQAGSIFIYDLRGQLITTLNAKKDQALISFDANLLSSGIYLASFKGLDNNSETLRIVKQ